MRRSSPTLAPLIPLLTALFLLCSLPAAAAGTAAGTNKPDLDAMIGQMLMAGFRGFTVDDNSPIVRDIRERNLGGVVLFDYDVALGSPDRNIDNPAQVAAPDLDPGRLRSHAPAGGRGPGRRAGAAAQARTRVHGIALGQGIGRHGRRGRQGCRGPWWARPCTRRASILISRPWPMWTSTRTARPSAGLAAAFPPIRPGWAAAPGCFWPGLASRGR